MELDTGWIGGVGFIVLLFHVFELLGTMTFSVVVYVGGATVCVVGGCVEFNLCRFVL